MGLEVNAILILIPIPIPISISTGWDCGLGFGIAIGVPGAIAVVGIATINRTGTAIAIEISIGNGIAFKIGILGLQSGPNRPERMAMNVGHEKTDTFVVRQSHRLLLPSAAWLWVWLSPLMAFFCFVAL